MKLSSNEKGFYFSIESGNGKYGPETNTPKKLHTL